VQPAAPQTVVASAAALKGNENAAKPFGGNPPLGLDGYCPVTLWEKQEWALGNRQWGAVHLGRTYLFRGEEEQRRFFADPDRYAPVASGYDVVLAVEQGQLVPGARNWGCYYGDRVYLFSSVDSMKKFEANPAMYAERAAEVLRMNTRPGRSTP
jgi:YHS domain-containing protein